MDKQAPQGIQPVAPMSGTPNIPVSPNIASPTTQAIAGSPNIASPNIATSPNITASPSIDSPDIFTPVAVGQEIVSPNIASPTPAATIAQATPLAEIRRLAPEGQEAFIPLLRPVDSVFAEFPCVRVSEKQAQRFRNGAPLLLSRLKSLSTPVQQTFYRVYAPDGCFLGIGEPSMATEELLVKKLFDKN